MSFLSRFFRRNREEPNPDLPEKEGRIGESELPPTMDNPADINPANDTRQSIPDPISSRSISVMAADEGGLHKDSKETDPGLDQPDKLVQRAVESILDNESLTEDLDDRAAAVLLGWGSDLAKQVVASTSGLGDESAEEALSQQMQSVRRMMRSVNKWAAFQGTMDHEDRVEALSKIIAVLPQGIRVQLNAPTNTVLVDWAANLANLADQPSKAIAELRRLMEDSRPPPV